jgi:hypothetical protein
MIEIQATHSIRCRLAFDTSALETQIEELEHLLSLNFPDHFQGDLACLCEDVVFSDCKSTVGADGTVEVRNTLRFGPKFENLVAALRAHERDDFIRLLGHSPHSTAAR